MIPWMVGGVCALAWTATGIGTAISMIRSSHLTLWGAFRVDPGLTALILLYGALAGPLLLLTR